MRSRMAMIVGTLPALLLLLLEPAAMAAERQVPTRIPRPYVDKMGRKGKEQFNMIFLGAWATNPGPGLYQMDGAILPKLRTNGLSFHLVRPFSNFRGDAMMSTQLEATRDAVQHHLMPDLPTFILGHSMGGKGVVWSMSDPVIGDKIHGGIGIASFLARAHAKWKRAMGPEAMRDGGLPPGEVVRETIDRLRQQARGKDRKAARLAKGLLEDLDAAFTYDVADERARESGIQRPLLVLHGTRDGGISINYAQRLKEQNPGAILVPYAGGGHGGGPSKMMAAEVELFVRQHAGLEIPQKLVDRVGRDRQDLKEQLTAEKRFSRKIGEAIVVPVLDVVATAVENKPVVREKGDKKVRRPARKDKKVRQPARKDKKVRQPARKDNKVRQPEKKDNKVAAPAKKKKGGAEEQAKERTETGRRHTPRREVAQLIEVLEQGPESEAGLNAMNELVSIKAREAVPVLKRIIRGEIETPENRRSRFIYSMGRPNGANEWAMCALAALGDPSGADVLLEQAAKGNSWALRGLVAMGLEGTGDQLYQIAQEIQKPYEKVEVLGGAAALGHRQALGEVAAEFNRPRDGMSAEVAYVAMISLGEKKLVQTLNDPRDHVRLAAIRAMGGEKDRPVEAYRNALQRAATGDSSAINRSKAFKMLGRLFGPEAIVEAFGAEASRRVRDLARQVVAGPSYEAKQEARTALAEIALEVRRK